MPTVPKPQGEGWRPIPFMEIVKMTSSDGNWHWLVDRPPKLLLEDVGGRRLEFKLAGGAWLREVKSEQ